MGIYGLFERKSSKVAKIMHFPCLYTHSRAHTHTRTHPFTLHRSCHSWRYYKDLHLFPGDPNNKHDHYWSYPNPNLTIPQPRNTVPILKFKNVFMGIEFCPHNADKSPQCVCKHIFVLTMWETHILQKLEICRTAECDKGHRGCERDFIALLQDTV